MPYICKVFEKMAFLPLFPELFPGLGIGFCKIIDRLKHSFVIHFNV